MAQGFCDRISAMSTLTSRAAVRHVLGFRCFGCGREHEFAPLYDCPDCGSNLDVAYDYPLLRKTVTRPSLEADRKRNLWRYAPLLPLSPALPHLLPHVGWTPLYAARRVGRKLGLPRVYIKDDSRNPSASLKDRGSAVALMRAQALAKKVVAAASTGNISASLACLAAGTGLQAVVFVSRATPEAKLAQALAHGARVLTVPGGYDEAFALCRKTCDALGWYNRSTGLNPFTREGKKTVAYEICEQLDWTAPDVVFTAAGDGNTLSALWKGFKDLHALNLIDQVPKLVAVQAEGADSICRAFNGDGSLQARPGKTVADSVAIRLPRDGEAAVAALRQSIGDAVTVTDEEILSASRDLARHEGVFSEPAGALPLAGLYKARAADQVSETDRVVLIVGGHGLKNPGAALLANEHPALVGGLDAVRRWAKKTLS